MSAIPTASTPPSLPPCVAGCRRKTPQGSLPPAWPPQTLLHLAGVTARPSGLQTARWPSITWDQNPGSTSRAHRPPFLASCIFEPPPSSWTTSPISLHLQSRTGNHRPSFLLQEALSRPGPLSCSSLPSLCVAGRGTSAHWARVRLRPRPVAAGRHSGPALPRLLCPQLPGQAPGRHVGNVPCGGREQAGVPSAQQPLECLPMGRGRRGPCPPPGLAERGLRLSLAWPPSAFCPLIYHALCSAASNPDLDLGQVPTATVNGVCATWHFLRSVNI